jgi:hypothetical protein
MGGLAALAAFACLGMTTGTERASLSVGMNFKKVSATEAWGRVWAVGGTFYGFRIRGADFNITGLTYARASGAAAPRCTISGSPAVLDCRGSFPDGSSVFVGFAITGGGTSFQQENFFSPNPPGTPQFFTTNTLGPPLLPITATLRKGAGASQTVTFKGQSAFDDLEVLPVGFRIGRVTKMTPAGSCKAEGDGIDCALQLAKGKTGSVTFTTTSRVTNAADDEDEGVEVLLHGGDGTGDKFITESGIGSVGTYDLVAEIGRIPPYPVHEKVLSQDITELYAKNSDKSQYPSHPAKVTVKLERRGPYLFDEGIECADAVPELPPLQPGEEKPVCRLQFRHREDNYANHKGRMSVVLTLTCAKDLERNCANNRARSDIVVH